MREALYQTDELKLLLTVRNQADLAASLYSELATWSIRRPTNRNFRKKAIALCRANASFFDYFSLVGNLQSIVGSRNVKVLFFEDGISEMASQIMQFLGKPEEENPRSFPVERKRSHNAGHWSIQRGETRFRSLVIARLLELLRSIINSGFLGKRLKPALDKLSVLADQQRNNHRTATIHLTEEVEREFSLAYGGSNGRLSALLSRDLTELGYPTGH